MGLALRHTPPLIADTMRHACPGPASRRSFLLAGAAGLTGLGLADLLELRALSAAESAASSPLTSSKSVIFVWLPGGPPHLDMYDMKPEAPSAYRGDFRPIATNVPGIDVCELFPRHARLADKFSIVRSIAHEFADHGGGHKRFMTGRDPKEPVGFVNDYPAVGSMVAKSLERRSVGIPNYSLIVDAGRAQIDTFSLGTAYLGPSTSPFTVPGDPSEKGFRVQNLALDASTENRLADRASLLGGLDKLRREVDQSGAIEALDKFGRQAAELLTSQQAREAFDLSRESDALKERYGHHAWGYRLLLARRLVEAGSKFVTVVLENPFVSGVPHLKQGVYNWDSHAVNCHIFDDARVRFPIYDQSVTALIEDVFVRGLDKDCLIVVTGEFGRTPRIENQIGTQTGVRQPGRDHWPNSMSLIVSGGGLKMGQVVGSTDSKGERPKDRPMTPNDLWATVFRHLGIDYNLSFPDLHGRPMPILPFGEPIGELV